MYALVQDVMLRSRIDALARAAGLDARFFPSADALVDALVEPPELLVVDLSDRAGAGMALLERLEGRGAPNVLAFYAHTDDATRRRALELGAARVVPRSLLVKKFADLVRETTAA